MLRTNSKQAREHIRQYIRDNFDGSNYGIEEPETFPELAQIILDTFHSEKYHTAADINYYHGNENQAFIDWCSGLPSILDTCYYYNRSAVDDLGAILEETEEEKARFDEPAAETMLTHLIYREIFNGKAVKTK